MQNNLKFDNLDLDCIYVLSGGMKKTATGEIVPGDFETQDHHGLIAEGQVRCRAASVLWQKDKKIKVISSGAQLPLSQKDGEKAKYSEVYKSELVRLGIDSESVMESTKPIDTITELLSLIKFIEQYNWKKVLAICNRAQIQRTEVLWKAVLNYPLHDMINYDANEADISLKLFTNRFIYRREQLLDFEFLKALKYFQSENPAVSIVPCEDIIEHFYPEEKEYFAKVYKYEGFQKRFLSEEMGINDILTGKYYVPKS